MSGKLTSKALTKFEATRDVWQEVSDGVREIKAGGGKGTKVYAKSYVARVRLKSVPSPAIVLCPSFFSTDLVDSTHGMPIYGQKLFTELRKRSHSESAAVRHQSCRPLVHTELIPKSHTVTQTSMCTRQKRLSH